MFPYHLANQGGSLDKSEGKESVDLKGLTAGRPTFQMALFRKLGLDLVGKLFAKVLIGREQLSDSRAPEDTGLAHLAHTSTV